MCRPVFEGMQRGNPGLIMAAIRYILLTPPLAWLSIRAAMGFDWPGLYGMTMGLLAVSAVSSIAFYLWLRSSLPTGGSPRTLQESV
jgi:Na+-driven multidrug efflux pump